MDLAAKILRHSQKWLPKVCRFCVTLLFYQTYGWLYAEYMVVSLDENQSHKNFHQQSFVDRSVSYVSHVILHMTSKLRITAEDSGQVVTFLTAIPSLIDCDVVSNYSSFLTFLLSIHTYIHLAPGINSHPYVLIPLSYFQIELQNLQ